MKTIKNFKVNGLVKNELLNIKGGEWMLTSYRYNSNGSVTERWLDDQNGDGVQNNGERVVIMTYGPLQR